MTKWDPDRYEEFFGERIQPAHDLMARIEISGSGLIVDLGCGTGRLTAELAIRWPDASVIGIDRSPEMIAVAPRTGVTYELADIESWSPATPVRLIYANSSLHWIPDHPALFPRLVETLAPDGVLAVQMPLSWDQPSHRTLRDVGTEYDIEIASPPTLAPNDYNEILTERAGRTEVWVTTYYHVLRGENPVFRWVSATGVKRFLDRLPERHHAAYLEECARRITAAYPPNSRGETVFPFNRLFILARSQS